MGQPQVLVGRYTLLRQLGSGAMGTVWLARDETLHREVAAKQVTAALPGHGEAAQIARQRAMREGRLAARLNHPNAVSIYDVALHEDDPWLVMEYVPSRTLTEIVQQDGPIPPRRAALLGVQLASALAEAHRVGIVHRDIKPSNVLLTETGEAKITDFGISRGLGDLTLTDTGLVAGTPAYFAPELARGGDPSAASDVWSLGATLYYAVEGRAPFGVDANPLVLLGRVASQEVPEPQRAGVLGPALGSLLTREPEDRPTMAQARSLLAVVNPEATIALGNLTELDLVPAEPETARLRPEPDLDRDGDAAELDTDTDTSFDIESDDLAAIDAVLDADDADDAEPPAPVRPAPKRSRRGVWLVACAIVAVLAGLGSYLVWGGQQPGGENSRTTGGAGPTPTGTPDASRVGTPAATPVSVPPKAPKPSVSKTPHASKSPPPPAPKDPMRAGPMAKLVTDYYAMMPHDTRSGWQLLGPRLKRQGYGSYAGFWSTIRSVRVSNVRAQPGSKTVTANVTFVKTNGRRSAERHRFTLVKTPDGTRVLINRDTNIS